MEELWMLFYQTETSNHNKVSRNMTQLYWEYLHPNAEEMMGMVSGWISEGNPEPAAKQIDAMYRHGGGWHPLQGWQLVDKQTGKMKYPGDPALLPIASAKLREERIFAYPHAWFCVVQKDGSFEMARID